MHTNLNSLASRSLLVLAALVAVTSCSAETPDQAAAHTPNLGVDPTSTLELEGVGGMTELDWTVKEIAARSQALVRVEVVDVERSVFNTSDGGLPAAEDLNGIDMSALEVYTPVRVRLVEDAVGQVPVTKQGQEFTILVGGGQFITDVNAEQAKALGLLKMVDEDGNDFVPKEGVPGDGIEVPADGPVEGVRFGIGPAVALSEGDRVSIFLTPTTITGYRGAGDIEMLAPTHSRAVIQDLTADEATTLSALLDSA